MFNLFNKKKKPSLLEENIMNTKEFIKTNIITRITIFNTSKNDSIEHKVNFINWEDYIEVLNPFDIDYYEEKDLVDINIFTNEFVFKSEGHIVKVNNNTYTLSPDTFFEKNKINKVISYDFNEWIEIEINEKKSKVLLLNLDKSKCLISSDNKIEINSKIALLTDFIQKDYVIKGFTEVEEKIEDNKYIYKIYFSTKEFNAFVLFNYLMKKERM